MTATTSERITAILGTPDWLIVHQGHHLAPADELDALEAATAAPSAGDPSTVTESQVAGGAAAILHRTTWPSLHWPNLDALHNRDVRIALARAVLEAEAHRTSQQRQVEPTVEEWTAEVAAERARHPEKGYTAEHDRKHGLKHLANWAIDYARRGKNVKASAMVVALLDTAQSVQVEVTDAMVEKAAQVMFEPPSLGQVDHPEYTWAQMVNEDQTRADMWRQDARAALSAALGGGE